MGERTVNCADILPLWEKLDLGCLTLYHPLGRRGLDLTLTLTSPRGIFLGRVALSACPSIAPRPHYLYSGSRTVPSRAFFCLKKTSHVNLL